MSEELAIEFREVSKTYKPRNREPIIALKGFNLRVPVGQIFGFAGPNGAGKSTAIKILVGLLSPTSGSVELFSHPAGSKQAKSLVGFLPEVTLYHDFMSASELLSIHATLAGVERAERAQKCEQALERVGLAERKNSRLKEFSKGMKQRFGIAQAIVGSPKLLVLDELTSGLDPSAQASLLNLLGSLREQGLTIFFSSHHLREIEKICDSVAILHKGVLRCSGTLEQVLGEEVEVFLRVRMPSGEPPSLEAGSWNKDIDGTFHSNVETRLVPGVLSHLSDSGGEVVALESRRKSLEELFMEMTVDDSAKEVAV